MNRYSRVYDGVWSAVVLVVVPCGCQRNRNKFNETESQGCSRQIDFGTLLGLVPARYIRRGRGFDTARDLRRELLETMAILLGSAIQALRGRGVGIDPANLVVGQGVGSVLVVSNRHLELSIPGAHLYHVEVGDAARVSKVDHAVYTVQLLQT